MLIANYVLGPVLGAGDIVVNITDMMPALLGERAHKQIEINIYLHPVISAKKK